MSFGSQVAGSGHSATNTSPRSFLLWSRSAATANTFGNALWFPPTITSTVRRRFTMSITSSGTPGISTASDPTAATFVDRLVDLVLAGFAPFHSSAAAKVMTPLAEGGFTFAFCCAR